MPSCFRCHAVACPQSNPPICPECFIETPLNHSLVGLQEFELSADEINEAKLNGKIPAQCDTTTTQWSFFLTDFDDVTAVSKETGEICVCVDNKWISWNEYVS